MFENVVTATGTETQVWPQKIIQGAVYMSEVGNYYIGARINGSGKSVLIGLKDGNRWSGDFETTFPRVPEGVTIYIETGGTS